MMSPEQFYKLRDTTGKFGEMNYRQYLQWVYKKDKDKLHLKILIASHILTLAFGIILGAWIS